MRITALFLAGYLFLGSLFPGMDYSQLTMLPNLFAHFQEHQAEAEITGEEFSLGSFLLMHFLAPQTHHQHDMAGHSHGELPLSILAGSFQFVPILDTWEMNWVPISNVADFLEREIPLPLGIIPDIFIPPSV